jgi:hypothetical protein
MCACTARRGRYGGSPRPSIAAFRRVPLGVDHERAVEAMRRIVWGGDGLRRTTTTPSRTPRTTNAALRRCIVRTSVGT